MTEWMLRKKEIQDKLNTSVEEYLENQVTMTSSQVCRVQMTRPNFYPRTFYEAQPNSGKCYRNVTTSKCTINTLCPQYNAQWVMLYEGLSQLINKVYLFSGNSPQDA